MPRHQFKKIIGTDTEKRKINKRDKIRDKATPMSSYQRRKDYVNYIQTM